MNFFEHQDRARSATRKLVFLFICAIIALTLVTTILVVVLLSLSDQSSSAAAPLSQALLTSDVFFGVGAAVITIVLFGSLYRLMQLRGGGQAVAEGLGGRLLNVQTRDADERKILNVVEEMAIAAGLQVPQVYLIEDPAINAFAAGYRQQDAVIGVTRGCITHLSREELQGVVAHEFSHIFNGDMRLNIRLIGWLYGIMVIGMLGYYLMRSSALRPSRGRNNKGAMVLLGLGLMVVGYSGTLFGNLIKAAVSRQREFLADASAVQFTRNPEGIGSALKKIASHGAQIASVDTAEISHMLFAHDLKSGFFGLFSTHPPLEQRIRRLDPNWNGEFASGPAAVGVGDAASSAGSADAAENANANASGGAGLAMVSGLIASIGNPQPANIGVARQQLDSLAPALAEAAHNTLGSCLLMHCLIIEASDPAFTRTQLHYLEQQLNAASFAQLQALRALVAELPRAHYLLLVDLALPALAQLSARQWQVFMHDLGQMIEADRRVSLFEWSLYRILRYSLDRKKVSGGQHADLNTMVPQCQLLMAAMARSGHVTATAARQAYAAGMESLQLPAGADMEWGDGEDVAALDAAMGRLQRLKPLHTARLLEALAVCIRADGSTVGAEAELLRAVGAVLDCPVPPFTGAQLA